jgi:hypothetical protein
MSVQVKKLDQGQYNIIKRFEQSPKKVYESGPETEIVLKTEMESIG